MKKFVRFALLSAVCILATFGAGVLIVLTLYWQEWLPQKQQRAVRAGVRWYRVELQRQEKREAARNGR